MSRRRLALAVVAAVALLASCSPRTTGVPLGDLTLTASFDDAQDLTVGHAVQISGVQVGTVTRLELDGYRAVATMSIEDGRNIPVGTIAALSRASLLGEHLIDLRLPKRAGASRTGAGPFVRSGAGLVGVEENDLEQLADKAADVLGAVSADDLGGVLETAYLGVGGKGPKLKTMIAELTRVVDLLAAQRADLAGVVDGLGRFGSAVGAASDDVGALIDDLDGASSSLAVNRDKFISAVRELTRFARNMNDTVLEPHGEKLSKLLQQLDPIVATLADNHAQLETLIVGLDSFMANIDDTVRNGRLFLYVWFGGVLPPSLGSELVSSRTGPPSSPFGLLVPVS